ncbi:MAG: FAD-dependent oxidoreductase [Candidatus Melainabacteria bacterium]|nr:FAD-dependent oxidoreductase [Candidatus Melainabacteria bacterium]
MDTRQKKIAIIGAGVAGMVAALELSKGGAKVVVFEKSSRAGGRAQTTHKEGYYLNLGPHALYAGGLAHRYLQNNGIDYRGAAPPLNRENLALYGGEVYELPVNLSSLFRATYLNWSEKVELAMFFRKLPKLDLDKIMSISLAQWLEVNVKKERVRQTIETFVRLSTYANSCQELSAGAAFAQVILANQGVLYLDHGWQTIVESIERKLNKESTSLRFGTLVQSVKQLADAVEIVVDEETFLFDAVLLCIPPQEVEKLLPDALSGQALSTCRAACLDVCLKRLPRPKHTFALGVDEPLYYSVHSTTAKLADGEGVLIHLAYYLEPQDNRDDHEERLLRLLGQLQPGYERELVYKRYLPHMVASYGLPRADLAGGSGLAHPRLEGYPSIFVCGDYVGRGWQLVDCAVNSSLEAVQTVLASRDEGVYGRWQKNVATATAESQG